jgi:predicted alpha/beta hydrolase family esterase
MKRVVLVHGWDGGPKLDWFPWLAQELTARGYEVIAPQLPNEHEPRKEAWVPALAAAVGTPDAETCFIAHSMGCQTVLRYLETLSEGAKVGGMLLVAGFVNHIINLETPEEEEVGHSWTDTPLDLAKVRAHVSKSIALFSDDDPWVTLDNGPIFHDALGAEVVVEHAAEHFTQEEEPAVLREALKLVS